MSSANQPKLLTFKPKYAILGAPNNTETTQGNNMKQQNKPAYKLPTHTLDSRMIDFIMSELSIDLINDFYFVESEQTGGWVMCDRYMAGDANDKRVFIVGDDGFSLYPSMNVWHQIDDDGEECDQSYDDCIGSDWDNMPWTDEELDSENGRVWPSTNLAPMLVMMSQMWTEEKTNIHRAELRQAIKNDHRKQRAFDELEAINYGRNLKKETK